MSCAQGYKSLHALDVLQTSSMYEWVNNNTISSKYVSKIFDV